MRHRSGLLVAALAVAVSSAAAARHHPLAELYERGRTLTLTGRVTAVEWANPHAVLTLSVDDGAGPARTWRIELDPPGTLQRRQWPRDRVTAGMTITVLAFPAKDGQASAVGRTVTLAGGEELVATTDASWNWRRVGSNPLR